MWIFHLITLIFHAIRALTNRSGTSAQRHTLRSDPIVIDCPLCGTLGLAAELHVVSRAGASAPWQRVETRYECGTCRRSMNASAFHHDGTGVMKSKFWACQSCQMSNSAVLPNCQRCGAQFE